MRATATILALTVSLAVLGCGGDGPTGSDGDVSVLGTWSYVAQFPEDGCTFSARLELDQAAGSVVGQVRDPVLTCDGDNLFPASVQLADGSVDGASIEFRMLTYRHTGTVSGDEMSGQASDGDFDIRDGPTDIQVVDGDGTWMATR